MLPHGLEGAVAPAVALPPELAERGGRFGPGDRGLFVDHSPAGSADGHGEVGVLGERVVADTADLEKCLPPEGSDGTGNGRHALEKIEHAPVEVEPDDVFDVLPATEDPAPVGDLGVAADRPDGQVGERFDDLA